MPDIIDINTFKKLNTKQLTILNNIKSRITEGMIVYEFIDTYYHTQMGIVYKYDKNKDHYIKIKPFITKDGYVEYVLRKNDGKQTHIQAHRLTALLFLKKPSNPLMKYVNHKNGDKMDNSVGNVEWSTASENNLHKYRVLGHEPWNKGKTTKK